MELLTSEGVSAHHAIERRLYEVSDILLPAHDHAQNARHHTSYGYRSETVNLHMASQKRAVIDRQRARKIDAHQVIFLRPQVCGIGQVVIGSGLASRIPRRISSSVWESIQTRRLSFVSGTFAI